MNLIKTHTPDSQIVLSESATEAKKTLILASSEIVSVASAEESKTARELIARLDLHLKDFEKARVAAKAPFLEICQKIDALNRDHSTSLAAERKRLSDMTAKYEADVQRKAQEAAAKARAEAEKLERDRLAAIAEAEQKKRDAEKSGDAIAALEAEIAAETAKEQLPAAVVIPDAPKTVAGIRTETVIEVVNIKALYAEFPMFVRLEPELAMIRAAVKAGQKLPGVLVTEKPVISKRRGL